MTLVNDIRKSVTDTTPVYAAVGVTDLAVEMVREAGVRATAARADFGVRATAARADFHVSALQDQAVKRAEKVAEQAHNIPALALNQTLEAASKAHSTYAELAVRGEKLVARIRNQKATKDLLAQAGSTVSLGKGAVTTVRKAAVDTGRAAKSTLTTAAPRTSATRTSAKRTATVAKTSTASAKRATKAVATSAGKTATSATKAAKTATPKVGD